MTWTGEGVQAPGALEPREPLSALRQLQHAQPKAAPPRCMPRVPPSPHAAGKRGERQPLAGGCAPGSPARPVPEPRSPPRARSTPSPGPRPVPPRPHLAWTDVPRAAARGHAPRAHPPGRLPVPWPLPGPQPPRSALPRGGERSGRRRRRGRGRGPRGQRRRRRASRGSAQSAACETRRRVHPRPASAAVDSAGWAKGVYPRDPLSGPRLGAGAEGHLAVMQWVSPLGPQPARPGTALVSAGSAVTLISRARP